MFQRARGVLTRLVNDPPSAWLALPLGCSLSALVAAAFGVDRSMVLFALYVLLVTVIGVVTTRSAVAAENVGLSLLALFFGALALFCFYAAEQGTRGPGASGVFVVIMLAAAASCSVACGLCISGIVVFHRRMRGEPTTTNETPPANNEATTRQG